MEDAMDSRHNVRMLEEACRVDSEIKALARRRNRDAFAIAERLLEMKENGLAAALGFESVQAYADRELGYSASKTRALLGLAANVRDLPELGEAAEAGELPW